MYPDLQPPLPLSHHHYAAMALPQPGPASTPAPRAVLSVPIAEARLRNILMGV